MDIILAKKRKAAYDDAEVAIANIKKDPKQEYVLDLQKALNLMFDAKCISILYTQNTDKLFFGVYAMPKIPAEQVINIITSSSTYIINEYYLELDSKLFQMDIDLKPSEIMAILIYDIGRMVNDGSPSEVVSKAIDRYLLANNDVLRISDSINYMELLSFGFRDAIRKYITLVNKDKVEDNEVMYDYYESINYKHNLYNAFRKLEACFYNYNKEADNKFVVLAWVLRLYKDVLHNRIPAIETLKRCKLLTGSKIEIREMDNVIKRLNRIDDDQLLKESANVLLEEVKENILPNKSKKPIPQALDDDLIKLELEQQNELYNEPDAVPNLIANINSKLAFIQDYIENNQLTKAEFKQLNDMYKGLTLKRNQLFKGDLYDERFKKYSVYFDLDDR